MSPNLGDPGVSRRRLLTAVGATASVAAVPGLRSVLAAADTAGWAPAATDATDTTQAVTPIALGLDYSKAPHPSTDAMTTAGYGFVVRYLSNSGAKNLTRDEARQLTGAGIAVVCNWEAAQYAPRKGYAQGVTDATTAQQQAADCGMPADRPIYFSVDWDVQAEEMSAISSYFDGIASVLGVARTGAYSSYDALGALVESGRISWAWQSCSTSFSEGRNQNPYPGIQLWQNQASFTFDGADVDGDAALAADFGQWDTQIAETNQPNQAALSPQGGGGRVAGGVHSDGRVEVFVVTPSGGIENKSKSGPDAAWSDWSGFGPAKAFGYAAVATAVATGRHADGRLEVFAVMADGSVQNRFETTANGAWSDWNAFAVINTTRAIAVGVRADGQVEVFGVTPYGVVQSMDEASNGTWSSWNDFNLDGSVASVAVVTLADGRLEVFAVMQDGSMRNRVETKANGAWGDWDVYSPAGVADGKGLPGALAAGVHADGRVEVFVVTPAGAIQNRVESAPGGDWSTWGTGFGPDGVVKATTVNRHADGRLEVFAVMADGSVRNRTETAANGAWSDWTAFAPAGSVQT